MRRTLIPRSRDLDSHICAQCGRRLFLGVVYSVTIDGEKFTVCSMDCEKNLRERKRDQNR